jgi:hypothetical protein
MNPVEHRQQATQRLMAAAAAEPVVIDVDALLNRPGLDYIDRALIKAMAVIVGGGR